MVSTLRSVPCVVGIWKPAVDVIADVLQVSRQVARLRHPAVVRDAVIVDDWERRVPRRAVRSRAPDATLRQVPW